MKLKRFKVTSELITSRFEGYVMAKSKKEAIRRFESNEDMLDIREYAECEQINIQCQEIKNA